MNLKYGVWTADGIYIEGSNDLTIYVNPERGELRIIHVEASHAKVGVQQDFSVAPCPSADIPCANYWGYTSGAHAWQAIKGNVTVLEILNR